MSRRALVMLAMGAVLASACEDRGTRTRKVLEPYKVVPGTPQVDTGAPKVLEDPTRANDGFAISVPRQCDLYQQLTVRKVDILWVVDSSGSMAPKQARLAANFQGFMNQLVNAKPPIDFHIAVASTDTDDAAARGQLRPWTQNGKSASYISCVPNAAGTGSNCNTGATADAGTADAVTAFDQMARVGTGGSAQERGLLAAYYVLGNPDNKSTATVERFLRPDAALYVVFVSDEDDSSCNPLAKQPVCTADPGCRCAPETALSANGAYGSTAYFTRFFETYKGYGNQDLVTVAAIVALEGQLDAGVPSQFGEPSQHVGCCRPSAGQGACPTEGANDGGYEVAYFGGRYLKVASDTGGVAVSICADDFSGALSSLGYAASGLRKEFRLSRGPELRVSGTTAQGVELYVSPPTAANCQVDGNCPAGQACRAGRCARKLPVSTAPAPGGAQYLRCDASAFRNVIRFDTSAVPESLSTVEVCYDVQAEFQTTCP